MIKPIALSGLIMMLSTFSSYAEETVMRVTTVDGKNLTVNLEEGMQGVVWTNFNDPDAPLNLAIYTGNPAKDETGRPVDSDTETNKGKVYLDIPIPGLEELVLTTSDSSVSAIDTTSISVDINNGAIGVTGVMNPIRVRVVNAAGLTVVDKRVSSDATFDLKPFGKGVYVVSVDGSTFKFQVR